MIELAIYFSSIGNSGISTTDYLSQLNTSGKDLNHSFSWYNISSLITLFTFILVNFFIWTRKEKTIVKQSLFEKFNFYKLKEKNHEK